MPARGSLETYPTTPRRGFGSAMLGIEYGRTIRRASWPGGDYVFKHVDHTIHAFAENLPAQAFPPRGDELATVDVRHYKLAPCLAYLAHGSTYPQAWQPTQDDIFARDWIVL